MPAATQYTMVCASPSLKIPPTVKTQQQRLDPRLLVRQEERHVVDLIVLKDAVEKVKGSMYTDRIVL